MPAGQDVQVRWTFSQPENYGLLSWILIYNQAGSVTGGFEGYSNTELYGFFKTPETRTVTFKCRIHWLLDDTRINGI